MADPELVHTVLQQGPQVTVAAVFDNGLYLCRDPVPQSQHDIGSSHGNAVQDDVRFRILRSHSPRPGRHIPALQGTHRQIPAFTAA